MYIMSVLTCLHVASLISSARCLSLLSGSWSSEYSPQLSHLSLLLSAASSSADPEACYRNAGLPARFGPLSNVTHLAVPQPGRLSLSWSGFVARLPALRLTVLAYRGTATYEQLMSEIMQLMTESPVASPIGGRVQAYFSEAEQAVWAALGPAYRAVRSAQPGDSVLITGHSLGAAMAALGAVRIAQSGLEHATDRLALYTFGEPRLGDGEFATAFGKLVPSSWRVVHGLDPVPHLPACKVTPQSRQCESSRLNLSSPFHHGTEVFYPEGQPMLPGGGNFRICLGEPRNEDGACSDSVYGRKPPPCLWGLRECVRAHMTYFGVEVGLWWTSSRCRDNPDVSRDWL